MYETIFARIPGAEDRGAGRSKWQTRWTQGLWLGRSEDSDAHIVYVDGRVGEYHTVRRMAETDPRRWDSDMVKTLNVTPWRLQDAEVRAEAAASSSTRQPPLKYTLPGGATMSSSSAAAGTEQIVPMRLRPLTPGCAACAKRGQASHGMRHSMECKRRKTSWLETQLGPPKFEDVPMVCAEAEAPKRSSPEGQDKPSDKPTKRLREKTTLGTKRGAEEPLEELEHPRDDQGDTQMNLMETLMMESKATEMTSKEDEEEQIQLESGWQWAPRSWVTKGDVKEMQGLVDKGCLKFVASAPEGAKTISSKVVRTFKGDGVKSRLALRDIAHGKPKPAGGELYATTPSVAAMRTVTAIAATWRIGGRKKGEPHGDHR